MAVRRASVGCQFSRQRASRRSIRGMARHRNREAKSLSEGAADESRKLVRLTNQ